MTNILDFLKEVIEGGFLGQAIIATLVWGAIVLLLVNQNPVDDRLYDAGYVVLGYFFHVAQMAAASRNKSVAKRVADDCIETLARNGR